MNIRAIVLGMTVASAIASGARATDAVVPDPSQATDDQNVNACDRYGTGYFQLPGTDTCARVSGQLRYQMGVSSTTGHTSGGRTTLDFETRSN